MATTEPWFLRDRAEALAALNLTRRKDLDVIPTSRYSLDPGYDLLVRIRQDNGHDVPSFGIEVKGVIAGQLRESNVEQGIFTVAYAPEVITASQLPVCVFAFAVDTEEGFYRWLHKPVFYMSGDTVLETDDVVLRSRLNRRNQLVVTSKFERLTDATIGQIVQAVSIWHEAKYKLVS